MAEVEEGRERVEREAEIWGTWEELLLVSAVNKHGTKNWDSVAMEIQNRITCPNFLLTPHNCKERYRQLRRRFIAIDDKINDFKNESETDTDIKVDEDDDANTIPWLEELRKLRVAELRREVQQYDVSIVSLQSKVKRLREERERSPNGEVKPDLERVRPENQSFNESNSTDPKPENEPDESDKKPDPVAGESRNDKPVGEGSYNGSSETIQALHKSSEAIPKTEPGDSPELWESVAESKGEEEREGTKENSDVQSSASLSMENRRKKDVAVSSSGEEPETDEISPAIKRISVKSHPLGKFIEIIKTHKYGCVFERRLESQGTSEYKSLIKQHVDLETVNNRLKEGQYTGCTRKFFRDLLLLINNAIVFFPNNSLEFNAAIELRQVVSKEMSSRIRKKSSQSPKTQPPPPPLPTTISPPPPPPPPPPADPEPSETLPLKPKLAAPMIVCRKRSSITKAAAAGAVSEKKVEKKEPVLNLIEEPIVLKEGKKSRSARPVGKSQNPNPSSNPSSSSKRETPVPPVHVPADDDDGENENDDREKGEKDKKNSTVAKKRSVANFLNRMKKNNNNGGNLLESLKNSGNEKKSSGGGGGGKAVLPSKTSRKQSSPPKRNVGRPSKRNASPVTPAVPSKRDREAAEMDVSTSKQRKRSRR